MRRSSLACNLVVLLWQIASAESAPAQTVDDLFLREIQPLLKQKCLACHGGDPRLRGNLDLRSRAGLLKGGVSGPALIPGDAARSLLFQALLWEGELKMPPKESERLSKSQVAAFKTWIDAAAPWPAARTDTGWRSDAKDGVLVSTSGGLSPDWTQRKYHPEDIWAYRPVRRPPVPDKDSHAADIHNPIDAFIRATLRPKGFEPAAADDASAFIRRVTWNLTGLPPTPAEIDAFLKNSDRTAVIERLLASPHYGEQMARHWLDVVRYADSSGFSNDYERPNAWRYRDYVIRSFNQDKPFDRFIVEQLAGDELDDQDPELLIAAGFLRMGPWEHTGMSVAAVTRQYFLDDVTNSVGVTFLAQPLRCASCHDHKFDPIPTRDYYRVQAVFAPVQFAERNVPFQDFDNTSACADGLARTDRRLQETQELLAQLSAKREAATAAYLQSRGVKSINDLPATERSSGMYFGLTALEKSLDKVYRKRISLLERERLRYQPYAYSVYSGTNNGYTSNKALFPLPAQRQGPIQTVCILERGALDSPGERVTPGVLSAVAGSNDRVQPSAWNTLPEAVDGRRLAFARWVASANNTLTARVIVNRVWQWHFGRGLVATPNNFGKMGARPTHPELLDWLSSWFVEHEWSIKKLNRLIVTSATYQQAGDHARMDELRKADANNHWLAYFPPRRLAAEEIRDGMLAISGEFNAERGGPGIFPEINWEVALQPRHLMGSLAPAYQPSPRPEQRNRRTIYAMRWRTLSDPMLDVLNRPGTEVSCERRDETTVAPQAFALWNGRFTSDRALALAARLEKTTNERAQQVRDAFRAVYGRTASVEELRRCLQHLDVMTEHHRRHVPVKDTLPVTVQRQMVEELTGETFTITEELDALKNYQRDLQPWQVTAETRALAELCLVLLNSNEFLYLR